MNTAYRGHYSAAYVQDLRQRGFYAEAEAAEQQAFGTHAPADAMANAVGDAAPQQEPRALEGVEGFEDWWRTYHGPVEHQMDKGFYWRKEYARDGWKASRAALSPSTPTSPAEPVAAVTDVMVEAAGRRIADADSTGSYEENQDYFDRLARAALVAPAEPIAVVTDAMVEAVKLLRWGADSYDEHAKCTEVLDEIEGYAGSAQMFRKAADALEAALVAPAKEKRTSRTPQEIVDQTNAVTRLFLRHLGTGYDAPEGYRFQDAAHPRGQRAWSFACKVQEELTATDPNDAVSELEAPAKEIAPGMTDLMVSPEEIDRFITENPPTVEENAP